MGRRDRTESRFQDHAEQHFRIAVVCGSVYDAFSFLRAGILEKFDRCESEFRLQSEFAFVFPAF